MNHLLTHALSIWPAAQLPAGLAWIGHHLRRRLARRWRRDAACALATLDTRTLHDIGIRRSEIESIVGECDGSIEPTRVHAPRAAPAPHRVA